VFCFSKREQVPSSTPSFLKEGLKPPFNAPCPVELYLLNTYTSLALKIGIWFLEFGISPKGYWFPLQWVPFFVICRDGSLDLSEKRAHLKVRPYSSNIFKYIGI
jgi:hypothetical protein